MVYELRKHDSIDEFNQGKSIGVIAWETDEVMDSDNLHFCGNLVTHVFNEKAIKIPNGIESLEYSFLIPPGAWGSPVENVHIPASVKTIKEGAFANSDVHEITIDPESPCGIVKDNGVYTKDEKTLLWILGPNNETANGFEYIVHDGVERIAVDFCSAGIDVLVVPSSVTYIGFNENNDFFFLVAKMRAPKGSYAIEFAKEHKMRFEETE